MYEIKIKFSWARGKKEKKKKKNKKMSRQINYKIIIQLEDVEIN